MVDTNYTDKQLKNEKTHRTPGSINFQRTSESGNQCRQSVSRPESLKEKKREEYGDNVEPRLTVSKR